MNRAAVAIILARAGSKGVPGKNTAMVGGRPCIAWTIDAAQRSRTVARVVVSTDSAEAAAAARAAGAEVVDRPADLAGDTATVDAAARHAIAHAPERIAVILYANVPVRPEGLIDRAVDLLVREEADSVQSYASVGKYHPWWTAVVDPQSGRVRPWEGDVLNHGVFRRQDLPPAHIPDGGVIAVTRPALFCQLSGVAPGPHAFFGRPDRRRGIINPEGAVVDIDSPVDLVVADALLSEQNRARKEAGRTPYASSNVTSSETKNHPLAYLITYHTYGTWLHGDERGSVDRHENEFGTPMHEPDADWKTASSDRLAAEPLVLDEYARGIVATTILQVCEHRGWILHAVNVRSNHVHAVVTGPINPERIMNDFKSWSTRKLVDARCIPTGRPVWTRHGSTRYLWDTTSVRGAAVYVDQRQ